MKNLLVAQSGGPTAAINATLCGVIEKAMINTAIEKIYGVRNGVLGILSEKLIELKPALFNTTSLQLLCQTPSSALGSCRMKLSDWKENSLEYEKIIDYAISIGIENGFIQEGETASESFIPAFDCEGI